MITAAREAGPPDRTGPDHVIVARDYGELLQALRVAVAARRNVTVVFDPAANRAAATRSAGARGTAAG